MNIYAGNLSHDVKEEDLRQAFQAFGQVENVSLIKDKFSGESRGFAFIEMPDSDEAEAAIEGLNSTQLKGRAISVNEARPKENRKSGGMGGGQRRGGGAGGGGMRRSSGGYGGGRQGSWG